MVHRRQFGNREFRLTASRSGRRETVNAPSGRVDRSRRLRRRRLARRVALGRCRIRRRIADGRKRVVPWSRRIGLHEIPPFTAPRDGSDPQRATFSNVPNGGRSAGAATRVGPLFGAGDEATQRGQRGPMDAENERLRRRERELEDRVATLEAQLGDGLRRPADGQRTSAASAELLSC